MKRHKPDGARQVYAPNVIEQGFSTVFCSWPTKLVRNGVGPFFLLMAHKLVRNGVGPDF